ncbi:MAG: hypothetical protein SRB2_04489 [Desulfobacteraceae bacterium Eth-SRB2]|nr:MAG: hypothetical protein SRB2_04489 [Desulfobacteraceae bacterium Eth-SRB2]
MVALNKGYHFITCEEYANKKANSVLPKRTLVNRVDIDFSCQKAKRLAEIFNRLRVKGSFFVRLHAPEYNPFSFENYNALKYLRDTGHEIGYHSEVIDEAAIWDEEAVECLKRDIEVLNAMLGIQIKGVASHGGMTGLNNLDFWKNNKASDFGLVYEAYEKSSTFNLFDESFYISDSEWTRWKCYNRGILVEGDRRSLEEHVQDRHALIYLLIHSDTYFDRHFYE